MADYNKALEINPKDGEALYNRGKLKFKLGDKSSACEDLKASKSSEYKYPEEYYKLICE